MEPVAGAAALDAARAAFTRQDWPAAHAAAAALAPLADAAAEADRLDLLADAAWWIGRIDECIEARERAYAAYDALGDHRRAGRCAVWLREHHNFKAQFAIAGAWLRRARRALEGDEECAEYGYLLLHEAEAAHGAGDLDRALELGRVAIALARRLHAPDLEAEALQNVGRSLVDAGEVDAGLGHLDEAMLFAVEGSLGPYTTGKVYCSLMSACEELGDDARAAEWTDATSRWADRHPFAVFPGLCRVHRATALERRGDWEQAEREVVRACEELAGLNVPNAAHAYAELADIRRRLGDLDGAQDALDHAERLCGRPAAVLALLRLAQGRVVEAAAIVTSGLDDERWNRLGRARLLAAQAQVAVAANDVAAADGAAAELEAIAADFGTPALRAAALTARGRVALARGAATEAVRTLRDAVALWQGLGVPYEAATARVLMGVACREAGDEAGAAASFAAASEVFDALGARLDARRLRDLTSGRALPAGLTEREAEVLRLVAAGATNKEVAATLGLSGKTVARHLSNIFTKIGVSTRAAATAFAFEHGVVAR